jgi:hypothetical protein
MLRLVFVEIMGTPRTVAAIITGNIHSINFELVIWLRIEKAAHMNNVALLFNIIDANHMLTSFFVPIASTASIMNRYDPRRRTGRRTLFSRTNFKK